MKSVVRISSLVLLFFGTSPVFAQLGGATVFPILSSTTSARVASMGGNAISIKDYDLNLGLVNPALLNKSMSTTVTFSYVDYLADLSMGHVAYAQEFKKLKGTLSAGIQSLSYGTFIEATAAGEKIGEFEAQDYVFSLGYGRTLDSNFSVGANLKWVYSELYNFYASGLAVDLAGHYSSRNRLFMATVLVKNAGMQIKSYTPGNSEDLPFEVQVGITKKLKHAPFRFTVIGENLQRWDLTYLDPTKKKVIGFDGVEVDPNSSGFGDKLMRHLVFNSEFLLTDGFNLRFGFNYRKRKELSIDNKPGTTGFTFGVGLRIKKVYISYGRANYHRASGSNHLTLSANIAQFRQKKVVLDKN